MVWSYSKRKREEDNQKAQETKMAHGRLRGKDSISRRETAVKRRITDDNCTMETMDVGCQYEYTWQRRCFSIIAELVPHETLGRDSCLPEWKIEGTIEKRRRTRFMARSTRPWHIGRVRRCCTVAQLMKPEVQH